MTAVPAQESAPSRYQEHLRTWEDLYAAGARTLALHAMRDATEAFPAAAEFWFLRGQTALAASDPRTARGHFEKARDLMASGKASPAGLPASRARAIAQCLGPLLEGLDRKSLANGPRDAWGWLDDPAVLGKANPSFADRMRAPLGRREPLMPLKPSARGATGTDDMVQGALKGQLAKVDLRRDSFEALLGRDSGLRIDARRGSLVDPELKIELGNIRIVDASVAMPPAAPPTAAPLPPVAAPLPSAARREAPSAGVAKSAAAAATVAAALPKAADLLKNPSRSAGTPSAPAAAAGSAAEKWDDWERRVEQLVESGKIPEALRQVDEALGRFPQSSRLAEIRAATLQRAGRLDEAAREWIETYRKAKATGAAERAERAHAEVRELARENGDLLMDFASLAAATGAGATAAAAGKLAADFYRRRNDRPRLQATLQKIAEWLPGDAETHAELKRIEATAPASSIPPPLASSRPVAAPRLPTVERVSPPAQDRVTPPAIARPLTEDERRERARSLDPAKHAAAPRKSGDPGVALLVGSFVVLVFALAATPVPAVIGYFVAHGYVSHAAKKDPASSHMTAKFARFLCVVAVVIGFLRCS